MVLKSLFKTLFSLTLWFSVWGSFRLFNSHWFSFPILCITRVTLFDRYASLASLPLHGSSFRSLGIEAHSSMHQMILPSSRPYPEARGLGSRFEQSFLGLPMFVEDDEAGLSWPGSFRQTRGNFVGFDSGQSSNINFVTLAPAPSADSSSPDLTLKL